jgi:hypothetical protein
VRLHQGGAGGRDDLQHDADAGPLAVRRRSQALPGTLNLTKRLANDLGEFH